MMCSAALEGWRRLALRRARDPSVLSCTIGTGKLVSLAGIEPATTDLEGRCSFLLSYKDLDWWYRKDLNLQWPVKRGTYRHGNHRHVMSLPSRRFILSAPANLWVGVSYSHDTKVIILL